MDKIGIDIDERVFLNEGMVMTLSLDKQYDDNYVIYYKLFKDDIDDGFNTDVIAFATKLQLKEFLLQLYYNDKLINI
jgi:hypothetical protein